MSLFILIITVYQYVAVEVLEVKHIMVVGHYGCGGASGIKWSDFGLIDNWLRHVGDVKEKQWTT